MLNMADYKVIQDHALTGGDTHEVTFQLPVEARLVDGAEKPLIGFTVRFTAASPPIGVQAGVVAEFTVTLNEVVVSRYSPTQSVSDHPFSRTIAVNGARFHSNEPNTLRFAVQNFGGWVEISDVVVYFQRAVSESDLGRRAPLTR